MATTMFRIFFVVALLAGCTAMGKSADDVSMDGFVLPYPPFFADASSAVYAVTVNGVSVHVHGYRNASYCHFAFTGRVRVVVTVCQTVDSYTLSPKSHGIPSSKHGSTIAFTLTKPEKLLLHKVNGFSEKLCIFADPLEEAVPRVGDDGVLDVSSWPGVDSTGRSDSAAGMNAAIDALPKNGVLLIPPGTYKLASRLDLKSSMTLYLAPGAELLSASDTISMIGAEDCADIVIRGRGRINGNGSVERKEKYTWHDLIDVHGCSNVRLEDVTLFDSPSAMVWTEYSDGVSYYNLTCLSDIAYANTDALDMLSCKNVEINDVFCLNTDDMCNNGTDATHPIINCQNITIRNCSYYDTMNYGAVAVAISGDIHHQVFDVHAENIDVIRSAAMFRFLNEHEGAKIHDCSFRNFRFEDQVDGAPDHGSGFICKTYRPHAEIYRMRFDGLWANRVGDCPRGEKSPFYGYDATSMLSDFVFNDFYISDTLVTDYATAQFSGVDNVKNIVFTGGTESRPSPQVSGDEK